MITMDNLMTLQVNMIYAARNIAIARWSYQRLTKVHHPNLFKTTAKFRFIYDIYDMIICSDNPVKMYKYLEEHRDDILTKLFKMYDSDVHKMTSDMVNEAELCVDVFTPDSMSDLVTFILNMNMFLCNVFKHTPSMLAEHRHSLN